MGQISQTFTFRVLLMKERWKKVNDIPVIEYRVHSLNYSPESKNLNAFNIKVTLGLYVKSTTKSVLWRVGNNTVGHLDTKPDRVMFRKLIRNFVFRWYLLRLLPPLQPVQNRWNKRWFCRGRLELSPLVWKSDKFFIQKRFWEYNFVIY